MEDVRACQPHLVRRNIAWATLNQAVSGLRFFFGITLGRADLPVRIPYARKAKSLPIVLGADTVEDLPDRTSEQEITKSTNQRAPSMSQAREQTRGVL